MTDSPMTPASAPAAPPSRPYTAPSLRPLGSIEAVTAGPVADGGDLDQLFGGTGGFNAVPDSTS